MAKGHVEQAQGRRDLRGLTPVDAVIPLGIPWSPRDKGPASWYPFLAVNLDHVKPILGPHDPPCLTPSLMLTRAPYMAVTQSGVPQLP